MNQFASFSFGAPEWLWALLIIPTLALLFWFAERRSTARLAAFVSPRLLPQLGATVNRFRRSLRFGFLLLGIALAITALARPRLGFTYEEVKRRGLDLIVAIDTSRSMLANDVPPNRLQRVKLSAHDLIRELRGDRIGLIAFAGRAFLQAPLTIDYDAALETLNELDTNVIPEGGSNIAEAINLAVQTFGKSAIGNRALIIFTDGEELAGEATKAAQGASDAGVRIFTVGVGTPEGSLIPLQAQGGTAFVKDGSGQVVKSKLDETRLREIAQASGGIFLPLGAGPATMRQLYNEGLAQMQAGEIDTKMSRQPIERYQWPLGAAILALVASVLIRERRRDSRRSSVAAVYDRRAAKRPKAPGGHRPPLQSAALLLLVFGSTVSVQAAAPGLEAYNRQEYSRAYEELRQTLEKHPNTRATDKIQFDAGAAAYKMKDYAKALQSFSQSLLSTDPSLQSRSHYNLGNTLYQRGETQKSKDEKLKDWTNALQHYDQTLKIEPENKEAKENSEFVKKKIEELQNQQPPQPTPTPSPSPSPSPQDKKDQQQDKDKDKQQKDQSGEGDSDKPEQGDPSEQQKDGSGKDQQQPPGQSPTPTPPPTPTPGASRTPGASPSPSPDGQNQASPSPGESGASPTPSPGEGEDSGNGSSPTPGPSAAITPAKKPTGDVKGAGEEESQQEAEGAEAEPVEEGQMSEQQAERLLQAMKDEEARVQLDERKKVRRVYKDW